MRPTAIIAMVFASRCRRALGLMGVGVLGVGAGAGCAQPERLEEVQVASASLTDLTTMGLTVVGGGAAGTATLDITTVDGEALSFDVDVGIGIAGGMMEMAVTRLHGRAAFDLSVVDAPTGADLLGTYDGFVASGAMLVGGAYHGLENEHHIGFDLGGFTTTLGLSMLVGHEWMTLSLADENDDGRGETPGEAPTTEDATNTEDPSPP